jgi:heptosyltransferase III
VVSAPFQRALVIRGGALGDFLLTLPVLNTLREAAPSSQLEVLAYPGIASLAKTSGLVDAVRSIEYGPLAGFFTRGTILDPGLRGFFGSFDLILSYLYDPDGIFAENLQNAGAARIIIGPHRPGESSHAIDQLAAPLTALGLPLAGRATRLALTPAAHGGALTIAMHPGSGSPAKNWPVENWRQLAGQLLAANPEVHLAIIGGEADAAAVGALRGLDKSRVAFWENLPLPELATRLAGTRLYLGHDTGVSHLAAACGAPSLLLFGPTDPGVWAPPHEQVRVLRAPDGNLPGLPVATVFATLTRFRVGPRLATGHEAPENPPS